MPNVEYPWGARSVRFPDAVADSELEHNVRNALPEPALFRRCDYRLTHHSLKGLNTFYYLQTPARGSHLSIDSFIHSFNHG